MSTHKTGAVVAWRIAFAAVVVVIAAWLAYYNRVKIRRLVGGESRAYIEEVGRRFEGSGNRFAFSNEHLGKMQEATRDRARATGSFEPVIEGKVAVFAKKGSAPLHSVHFEIPRGRRADDPNDVETMIWIDYDDGIEFLNAGKVVATQFSAGIHVYNLTSQSYYFKRLDRMSTEDIHEYVVKLAGG